MVENSEGGVIILLVALIMVAAIVAILWLALRDGQRSAKHGVGASSLEGWTDPPKDLTIHISHHAVWVISLGASRHVVCVDCEACSCHNLGKLAVECEGMEVADG